ncbi:FUSC family protein [Deinococcus lacus]|uniref:FUSC family protein n=1 Tax=Deinococcus lacus TaxID=392561 RepID=A0ABW1YAE5_9DEIO
MPGPLQQLRDLWVLAPAQRDHYPAVRISLGVAVPLLLLLLSGQVQLTLFVIFGTFTGLYGRHEPWRQRLWHQLCGGLMLVLGVALGLWLAHLRVTPLESVGVVAGVSTLLAPLTLWLGLRPAGAVFAVFAVGTLSQLPGLPTLGLWLTAASALWCLLLGVAGALYSRRVRPEELQPHPRDSHPPAGLLHFGLRHGLALVLAGTVSVWVGLGHNDWAMAAAAAVLGVLGQQVRIQRAWQRILGTLGGVVLAAGLLLLDLPAAASVALVIALQFAAQLYIVRNYAVGLLFITPLALIMSHLARPGPVALLLETRLLETIIGALSALVLVLLMPYRPPPEPGDEPGSEATPSPPELAARPLGSRFCQAAFTLRRLPRLRPGATPAGRPAGSRVRGTAH